MITMAIATMAMTTMAITTTMMMMTMTIVKMIRRATFALTSNAEAANPTKPSSNIHDTMTHVILAPLLYFRLVANLQTDAKCRVTCAGCGRNLLRVSILKRHVTTCRTLKKKQNIPQHKTAMNKMKQKLKKAAAKASQEARASLEASKRLNAMVADDTNPRKRMRLGECQNFLTPINSEEVHETIVDSNDFSRACQVVNLSSTQNRVRFNTKTSEFDKCANNFSKGQDPVNGATMHHPQVSAAQKSAIDLSTPSSHSTVIHYLATDAHRPILGADSHYPVPQDPTASEDSSYLLSTMDRSFAKDQFPAEQNSTTLRASSFFLNTMDGSFPDTQFLEEHNAKAIRGSSFLTNTMDGSYYPSNWSPQEFA